LQRICAFIDIPFDPSITQVAHVNRSETPYNASSETQGINASRVFYYRDVLSAEEEWGPAGWRLARYSKTGIRTFRSRPVRLLFEASRRPAGCCSRSLSWLRRGRTGGGLLRTRAPPPRVSGSASGSPRSSLGGAPEARWALHHPLSETGVWVFAFRKDACGSCCAK
jgi:hypothetical protein